MNIIKTSAEPFRRYMDPGEFERIRPYESLTAMWRASVEQFGPQPAIEDDGRTYTYAELEADAALYRAVLTDAGVEKGDRVGILCVNSYDFVKTFLAAVTLGCTAVILPPHLDAGSVFGCSMLYGLKALVYHPSLEESTALAAERAKIALLSSAAVGGRAAEAVDAAGNAPCVMMFTGGTTGKSKGALLSNEAVMEGIMNSCYGVRGVFGQRYLLVLPLSHVFGLIRNLLASLYTGSCMFICRSNQDMFRDIAAFRPTILVLVPALAEMALTLSKRFKRNMLGEVKTIICGAAAVAPYLIREYDAMGIALYPGYGLTESANLVSGNPENLSKPESVGLPFPNQELRVEDGELWLRGKNMMTGYLGVDPAEAAEAFEDGWFKTGDLVRFDEDGFLYITGRRKEIIVLPTGENVSPAEVEAFFNECPLVQDSQVFEDMNEQGKHFLALEVVPRATELAPLGEEGPQRLMAELERINAALLPFQQVSRIELRDKDFERTKSMKIVRYHKCK